MLHIIANKNAGNGKGAETLIKAEDYFKEINLPYTVHITEYPKHATEIAHSICSEAETEKIIVIGGDGTLNETLGGMDNFDKIPLAVLPCGTGNDFAEAAKIPFDIKENLDFILNGQPKFTDFLQMGDIRGLNAIGTGIDVDVLVRYAKHKKKTKKTYYKSLISALIHFKPYKFSAEFNGENKKYKAFLVLAANGISIGGGIPASPNSVLDDGLMDIVIVDSVAKIKIPSYLMKLMKGKILSLKETHYTRTDEIEVTPENYSGTVQVDGEIYEDVKMHVKVIHDVLKIYRP